jgi:hypothetical protein
MSRPILKALLALHNIQAISKRTNDIPHLRVKAPLDGVTPVLDSQNLVYNQVSVNDYPVTGADRFKDCIFEVLCSSGPVIIKVDSDSGVRQKILAPNNLKIEGKVYSDSAVLKQDIIAGLNSCGVSSDTVISCINILDAVENDTNIIITDTLRNATEKSKITSDFGEVVLAFRRLVKQGGTILFPVNSNQENIDFYKMGDSNIEKMFRAWYNRDMLGAFTYAAPDCPEINWWKEKLQGFTEANIAAYTQNHTWDEFVQSIKDSQNGDKLGTPNEEKNRSTYEKGDANPLMFALLTIWARYYNAHNGREFNKIVCKMFKNVKSDVVFEFFNYENKTGRVLISNQAITTYNKWDIHYHGNAKTSLNNYPAVKGLR